MTAPTTGRLRVDGATLHYEVRGSGPPLLLIPGGTGGAASYDGVADDLAAGYTVASYDPRGMSRSPLADPDAVQRVDRHADDAARLLDLLFPGAPAHVAGCSSGAIVALHLLTVDPGRAERVLAHEPPVVEVLPDAADHRALLARVGETLRREGLTSAASAFAAGLRRPGEEGPVTAPPPRAAARPEQEMANMAYFLGRVVPGFMAYVPDLDRLTAVSDHLVVAGGTDSRGELPHRAAACLADRVGAEFAHFPGGHVGLTTHPAEFAALLRTALGA
jgi:pimeloyl-ACP methyl ester carboxylesterase